jgi:hypothetical protein
VRVESLLSELQLTEHIMYDMSAKNMKYIAQKKIDWQKVDKNLTSLKSKGMAYLKNVVA